ncbi:MAG: AGCS family alanine or glycine:cation symporter [Bradymonadia bacterium]|jgi:AGCS family alanine or glycine:cation symporter
MTRHFASPLRSLALVLLVATFAAPASAQPSIAIPPAQAAQSLADLAASGELDRMRAERDAALAAEAEASGEAENADAETTQVAGDSEVEGIDGAAAAESEAEVAEPATGFAPIVQKIDAAFGVIVGWMAAVLFFSVPIPGTGPTPEEWAQAPIVVLWLFGGALFLTFRMKFINVRAFGHAIQVVRGKYDEPHGEGEVSHMQALSSALSATVGLGNIAGVALAVGIGGPGAVFWMIFAALLGMTAKFAECTLGQKYRTVDANGVVMGGPMRYLKAGLEKRGMGRLGVVLSTVFAVFCIGGSFGGGNMFQANQAYSAVNEALMTRADIHLPAWLFGLGMMAAVGAVILGGIKRIARTAELIVPLMCGMYIVAAMFIVLTNLGELPGAVSAIVSGAFGSEAVQGGAVGVLIVGLQRAAFSNEAGIGSAAIAHSAAKTSHPVREGLVALLEPFIDTVLVCSATGIVIVISGVLNDPALADADGAVLTMRAFEQTISWFPLVLTTAICLFAFSTMISWSYYGERCWTSLFGPNSSTAYRIVFLIFVFIGTVSKLTSVLDFSDLMILSMAFPNILGLYIMSNEVAVDLQDYMQKLKDGAFPMTK